MENQAIYASRFPPCEIPFLSFTTFCPAHIFRGSLTTTTTCLKTPSLTTPQTITTTTIIPFPDYYKICGVAKPLDDFDFETPNLEIAVRLSSLQFPEDNEATMKASPEIEVFSTAYTTLESRRFRQSYNKKYEVYLYYNRRVKSSLKAQARTQQRLKLLQDEWMRNWYELPFGSDYTSEDDEMRDSITEDMEMLLDRCYDDIRICNLRIQQFTLSADQALDLEDLKADRS